MDVACWEILRKNVIKNFFYIESEKDIEIAGAHNDKRDSHDIGKEHITTI